MKKILTVLTLLLFITNSFAQKEYLSELKKTNSISKQTILVFYKPNCPYCMQMETLIENDINFQKQITKNYNIQLINISTNQGKETAQKYNITGVPTLIKVNPNSIDEEKLKGFGSIARASFFLKLDSVGNNHTTLRNVLDCGNGVLEPGEVCDDGNLVSGDGCDNNCTVTSCGNGLVTTGEQCDDGNTTNGDGCSAICMAESICGNGILESGEVCDDGNLVSGDGCDNNCTVTSCGNGLVTTGEQCDDGNTINGDGCSAICMAESICGNGILEPGEVCDDGNLVSGDGCDNNCTVTSCGNGLVTTGEQCDDGNTINGDGCSAICMAESICGNGILEPGEVCDDGNLVNGDGCSNTCQLENSFNSSTGSFPDNSCTSANEFPILVSGIGVIGSSYNFDQIAINITHTFDADLDISLIAPNGTSIDLSSDNGGSGDNFTNTVFSINATTLITAGLAPFTGNFLPEGNLAILNGINADGTWTLRICDDSNQDTGNLNNATLSFAPVDLSENTFTQFIYNIYPNPVKDILNLSTDKNITNIKIYNTIGQEVVNKIINSSKAQIDISNLASGPYFFKIFTDNKTNTIKIIKQ